MIELCNAKLARIPADPWFQWGIDPSSYYLLHGDWPLCSVFIAAGVIPQGTKFNMGTYVITPYHSILAFRDQSLCLKITVKGSIPVNRKLNVGIDPYNNSLCLKNLGINPLINIFESRD